MINRRQLIRYAPAGILAAAGAAATHPRRAIAQTPSPRPAGELRLQWLGHTCFLFSGGGRRLLVNPFRTVGCTAGFRPPRVAVDLVMMSSPLFDEGSMENIVGNPRVLSEPGVYQLPGLQIQGITTDRSRLNGRWFPVNVVWRWNQGGINILHLGGIAQPITVEQQILMGRPDVLLVPVGGGPKAYTASQARDTVRKLNPRLVIPTHFLTKAANRAACDIQPVEEFLSLMSDASLRRAEGDTIVLKASDLPSQGFSIQLLGYKF